jgi:hypothetical protein
MTRQMAILVGCCAVLLTLSGVGAVPVLAAGLPGISGGEGKPLEKNSFKLKSGTIKIETKEISITCSSSEGTAIAAGGTSAEGSLTFTGCEAFSDKCTTEGLKAGEIKANLAIYVVLLNTEKKEIGSEFAVAAGEGKPSLSFICHGAGPCSGKEVKITGSFLFAATAQEKLNKEYTLEAGQSSKGVQSPLEYVEEGSEHKIKATLEATNPLKEGKAEEASFVGTEKVTFEEEVEFTQNVPVLQVPYAISIPAPERHMVVLRNNARIAALSVVSAAMIGNPAQTPEFTPEDVSNCNAMSPLAQCTMYLTFRTGAAGEYNGTNMELTANPGGRTFTTHVIKAKR